jgi:lysozyme
MKLIGKAGLDLIKSFEGLRLKPYLDSVKIPTIGYGTIVYPNGQKVTMNDPEITGTQAEQYLEHEVNEKTAAVNQFVTAQINQNQFDALVSFSYNVGSGALGKSTLLKMLNAGNTSGAAEEFLRWNKAGGQVIAGLTRRRQAERSLFLQSVAATGNQLPDGPSTEEIENKLKDIEKDIK